MQGEKQPQNPIATKNLNLIRAPRWGRSGFTEIAAWNRSARQGAWNETKEAGWPKPSDNGMPWEDFYAKHTQVLEP